MAIIIGIVIFLGLCGLKYWLDQKEKRKDDAEFWARLNPKEKERK